MRRPTLVLRLVRLLILMMVALAPMAAQSHASLVDADPAEGRVLPTAPSMIHLRFNEPVRPLAFRLFTPSEIYQDLKVEPYGEMLMISMPPGLGTGSHIL